jgi:hypothetical protein
LSAPAPGRHRERREPAGEARAEERTEFFPDKGESGLGRGLELAGKNAAEETLNDRPAERPQIVAPGPCAVETAEQVALGRQRVGLGKREEDLVGETERQARRGVEMPLGLGLEADGTAGEHGGGDGNNDCQRLDRPLVGFDPDRAALGDPSDSGAEGGGQARAEPGDQRAVAARQSPVGSGRGIIVGNEVLR